MHISPSPCTGPDPQELILHLRASLLAHQHHRWRDAEIPARPATGGAESTQTMGKAAADMCSVTGTTMAAELLRSTTAIHHFATHAARTQRIWLKTLSNAATSG